MKKLLIAVLKVLAAFLLAVAVWFPFGGIMWRSATVTSNSSGGSEPATQSHLGSVVFLFLFGLSLLVVFRYFRRRQEAAQSPSVTP